VQVITCDGQQIVLFRLKTSVISIVGTAVISDILGWQVQAADPYLLIDVKAFLTTE
jgi:hypothetical protein